LTHLKKNHFKENLPCSNMSYHSLFHRFSPGLFFQDPDYLAMQVH